MSVAICHLFRDPTTHRVAARGFLGHADGLSVLHPFRSGGRTLFRAKGCDGEIVYGFPYRDPTTHRTLVRAWYRDCDECLGSISGTVLCEGLPASLITVTAYLDAVEVGSDVTDGDGNYTIENLPSGTYTVQITVPDDWELCDGEDGEAEVELDCAEPVTGIDFCVCPTICEECPYPATITVTISGPFDWPCTQTYDLLNGEYTLSKVEDDCRYTYSAVHDTIQGTPDGMGGCTRGSIYRVITVFWSDNADGAGGDGWRCEVYENTVPGPGGNLKESAYLVADPCAFVGSYTPENVGPYPTDPLSIEVSL